MSPALIADALRNALVNKDKPLAIVLAGHNGSGKSTLWYQYIVDQMQLPLINADRMMLSVLPEADKNHQLPEWAEHLRDHNNLWMGIAQKGVSAFVAQCISAKAAFAMETVFSHWKRRPDGTYESKIDMILELQKAGYFVLLLFVGLSDVNLSVGRVATRKNDGGHDVDFNKLITRFPRTQKAVRWAVDIADAAILFDNSREKKLAFTPVQIRKKQQIVFDIRNNRSAAPIAITAWLDKVSPLKSTSKR
jgi:predicted ABC-type ATPase